MSTTLEPTQTRDESVSSSDSAANRLRSTMAASRLSFTWFGTTKSLTDSQKTIAANSFGADGEVLSAGKKLLDTKHPAYKDVSSVKSRITSYWKSETLPFPQTGVRLIRQDSVEAFNERLGELQLELEQAVSRLDNEFSQLKFAARDRLGDLFNEADYPASLDGLFSVTWDFPNVEVPEYLRRLKPELYRQEAERVARRFNQALELAEAAFTQELSELVEHLTERLTGQVDGKPKVFRDTAVSNLTSFFDRFRKLNVRSNEELDDLVETCQQIVQGRTPQSLRGNTLIRDSVVGELREVGVRLDQLLVDRPRRSLIRRAR